MVPVQWGQSPELARRHGSGPPAQQHMVNSPHTRSCGESDGVLPEGCYRSGGAGPPLLWGRAPLLWGRATTAVGQNCGAAPPHMAASQLVGEEVGDQVSSPLNCWHSHSNPLNTAGTLAPTHSILLALSLQPTQHCGHCRSNPLNTAGALPPAHSTLRALSFQPTQPCWQSYSNPLNTAGTRATTHSRLLAVLP